MKTGKVTEITKVNEWKWPNGTVYYINMKLDNNDTISLGKKKSDAFKVGDTINYEVIEENWKYKYKEVKDTIRDSIPVFVDRPVPYDREVAKPYVPKIFIILSAIGVGAIVVLGYRGIKIFKL